jgi:Uncharacterized conserved protein
MARAPDERYNEALKLFLQGKKLIEIANQLNLPEGTVRRWKSTHKWDSERSDNKSERSRKKKGGQPGNKNAVGNSGGTAPAKNDNAVKHGLFEKYLPKETLDIVNNMSLNPLDILWDQIQIAYAAIVRAQSIMHVKDKDDLTKELKRQKESNGETSDSWEKEYELQFAWDKQANFMKAQARAQSALNGMIRQYEELCRGDLATDEQKLRIEKLKVDVNKATGKGNEDELSKLDEMLAEIKRQAGDTNDT